MVPEKEIFSDYFGKHLVLKLFKDDDGLKFANLANIIHFLIKHLCDQFFIKKLSTHFYVDEILVGFFPPIKHLRTHPQENLRAHPPNKLRLNYLISLFPKDSQDLIKELIIATDQFFQ